jgi:hypothetical protein
MPLHQFDYIFAIAMIFGFLDAFMIGMLPSPAPANLLSLQM